jgi:hypothetical protein
LNAIVSRASIVDATTAVRRPPSVPFGERRDIEQTLRNRGGQPLCEQDRSRATAALRLFSASALDENERRRVCLSDMERTLEGRDRYEVCPSLTGAANARDSGHP